MEPSTRLNCQNQNVTPVGKPIKQRTIGTEQTRQTTPENDDTSLPYQQAKQANSPFPQSKSRPKTKIAGPTLRGIGRPEGIQNRGSPKLN